MKTQLEKLIYDKYPALYRQKDLSMQETCMCWGICVGDGWYKIIDKMSKQLTAYNDKHSLMTEATQVKEKFGTLRVYLNQSNSIIDKIVAEAEVASAKTCEICGKPGKLYTKGWCKVRCLACKKKEDNDYPIGGNYN
jgi:predicted DNA-binding protein YlxM (UPF0122 family)